MTCARCGSEGFGCYECTPDPFAIIARLTADRDAALAQVSAWQPIATAPRDETLFLATGLDGGSGPDRHVAIVFCDGAGFFDDFDEYTYLTHWMPLPAPPVDSSAAPSTPRLDNRRKAAILAAAEQEEQEE